MESEGPADECNAVVWCAREFVGKDACSCGFIHRSIIGYVQLKVEYCKDVMCSGGVDGFGISREVGDKKIGL